MEMQLLPWPAESSDMKVRNGSTNQLLTSGFENLICRPEQWCILWRDPSLTEVSLSHFLWRSILTKNLQMFRKAPGLKTKGSQASLSALCQQQNAWTNSSIHSILYRSVSFSSESIHPSGQVYVCRQVWCVCLSLSVFVCCVSCLWTMHPARVRRAFTHREWRVSLPEVCSGIDLIAPVYLQSRVSSRTGTGRRDKTVLTIHRVHKHVAHKGSPCVWSREQTLVQTRCLNCRNPYTVALCVTVIQTLDKVSLHCVPTGVFLQLHLYCRAQPRLLCSLLSPILQFSVQFLHQPTRLFSQAALDILLSLLVLISSNDTICLKALNKNRAYLCVCH